PITRAAEEEVSRRRGLADIYRLAAPDEKITILGFHFTPKFEMFPDTWTKLQQKLQQKLETIETRDISLKGRVLTANVLLASKIWYTSYVHQPTMAQADKIQRTLNNWARKGGKTLPSAETLQLPVHKGGWNLTTVKAALKAR